MSAQNSNKMSASQQLRAMGRVLGLMLKNYKFPFFMVVVCILGSALATLRGTLFMQSLIDDYIAPLTQAQTPDFSDLAAALVSVAITYGIGILCAYAYNRIMVNISQGTMRNLRVALFQHMESLPIRYFDTHAHGDIMSVYTNDVDTLRQLMSQSIPQVINSGVTILTSFVSMLVLDIPLTILTLVDDRRHGLCHLEDRGEVLHLFCPSAERPGRGQRLYRGNDGWAEGGQGVLP